MDHADDPTPRPYGRRAFLGLVGGGVSSLWWGPAVWNAIATNAVPASLRGALPSPTAGWRIYTVNPPMPRFDPATWRLQIEGRVRTPMSLTYRDLLSLPRAEQRSDFHCVTGWSVPGVRWAGVRFRDLLALAQPMPSAKGLAFMSSEQPYVDSLSLGQALVPDAMLAYEMDARPLTREHGAPARLVMPQMYGYKGVKWVNRIVVSDTVELGFWEQRGYDLDAWVGRSNGYG